MVGRAKPAQQVRFASDGTSTPRLGQNDRGCARAPHREGRGGRLFHPVASTLSSAPPSSSVSASRK
jgi:hypothetical protein